MSPLTVVDCERPAETPLEPTVVQKIPLHVHKKLLRGSTALGLAVVVERGMGFAANILAARLGGTATFGAYSLAISTANNISTYAGGGIGSTAARFSGKYPRESNGYATLARALFIVSIISALIAGGGLWLGAGPIARLMGKASLTALLRWTAISAVGIILLECARGFFIGQHRLSALILLSLAVGTGMLVLIPFGAAAHNSVRMILFQGTITTTAVVVCLLLARPLGLLPASAGSSLPLLPMLKEVWTFGSIQLAGLVGVNFAGWWLTTLLARADTTLVQMSFFAIASQLRNIAGLAPSLLTESSYAVMAAPASAESNTPQHVMALCTYASTVASFVLASMGIILVPWALRLVYGRNYSAAGVAVVVGLCVAVVHMGNAPAAARLSIVCIRATGIINTIWAAFVVAGSTLFLMHGGSAWRAMVIYLAGHLLSATLVLILLERKDYIPAGMIQAFCIGVVTSMMLAGLAWLRLSEVSSSLAINAGMTALFVLTTIGLLWFGRRQRWLPGAAAVLRLLQATLDRLRAAGAMLGGPPQGAAHE